MKDIGKRLRQIRDRALERKARAARDQSNAVFVGITGSSAKSTATGLLTHILSVHGAVLGQVKFNDRRSTLKTIARSRHGYAFVVVEAGVGSRNRMQPMAATLRPDIAVVTMVAIEHKSAFRTLEAVAQEKGELVAALQDGGVAVLNGDDPQVATMAKRTRERVLTFGRTTQCDFRATDVHAAYPDRLRLTAVWRGGALPLKTRFVGEHFWLPTLAAVATAIELGTPPDLVADRVASFEPLLERCGVLVIPDGPHFILDTTKAPWHSIGLAFDMLASAIAPRKRIVLGHMSDFAGSDQKYRDAYRLARASADQVVFVGQHAHRSKASQKDRDDGRFIAFNTVEQVAGHVRNTAIPGEVILLKGSVDLHLERIALSWKHDVKCWEPTCGHNSSCRDCGRYEYPYEWHKGRKRPHRVRRQFNKLLAKAPTA